MLTNLLTPSQPTTTRISPESPNPVMSLMKALRFLNHLIGSTPRSVKSMLVSSYYPCETTSPWIPPAGLLAGVERYHPFDIQNEQEAVLELVGSPDQLARRSLKGLGKPLERVFFDLPDLPNLVNEKAGRAILGMHDHVHAKLIGGTLVQLQAAMQINGCD